MIKTVEELSKQMSREEFDKFTEVEELCPGSFGLKDVLTGLECNLDRCKECFDKALVGIKFKSKLPSLPNETQPVLLKLQELEIQAKSIKEQQDLLKVDLLNAMETHGLKKWENDLMTVSYVAPTTRTTVDSKGLKADMPEVYEKYSKTSNVKSSIRIKLKGDK